MIKKHLMLLSISAAFYLQAQDVSVITNSINVYSDNSLNGSARYNAMAGATGALGGDGNALLNNPAGLGVAISGSVSGTLGLETYKNSSSFGGNSVDYNNELFNISNVNGVASFQLLTESPWKFINLGVNYSTQTLDNYVETVGNGDVVIQQNVPGSIATVLYDHTFDAHAYERVGDLSKMSIGLGANYDNRIYLGAGLNFHNANLEQRDFAQFHSSFDNSTKIYDKQYTPFSEQGSGFSANIGVIGKITNQLRLGASLETPTWWNIDRVYTDYYTEIDGVYYDNFAETRNFRSPFKATVSAALVPNKNFSINADYTIGLSDPHYSVDGPAETELNEFFDENSKNMSEIKVGAEYRIKGWRLRGGFAHATAPFDQITVNAYNSSGDTSSRGFDHLMIGSRNLIGLGLGYDFKSFFIDAAYQNISTTYDNPFLAGYQDFGTGYYGTNEGTSNGYDINSETSVVSEVDRNKNNFFLTFGWKF